MQLESAIEELSAERERLEAEVDRLKATEQEVAARAGEAKARAEAAQQEAAAAANEAEARAKAAQTRAEVAEARAEAAEKRAAASEQRATSKEEEAAARMSEAGRATARAVAALEQPAPLTLADEKPLELPQDEESSVTDKWRLVSWLLGAQIHHVVAAAIKVPLAEQGMGDSEGATLGFIRSLRSRSDLGKLLRRSAVTEGIIDAVWKEVETMQAAGAATSAEMQSKFSGAIELSYAKIDKFFGGVEGVRAWQ